MKKIEIVEHVINNTTISRSQAIQALSLIHIQMCIRDRPEPQEKQEEQHFAPQPDMSAGVTIDPASQGDNDDTF